MKKSLQLAVVFAIVFNFSSLRLVAQDTNVIMGLPFISNYSPESYKAGIQNWDITQNTNGLLYMANNLGLLEFDGSKWTSYPIRGTKVRSIFIAENQRIYVGSQADFGYLLPDAQGKLQYVSLADQLDASVRDFDETWKIYGIDDLIYFCTFENIYIYDGEEIRTVSSPNKLEISFLVNNRLYVQEWEKGISMLRDNRLELIRGGDFFKDKRVSNILNYDKDQLIITTFNHGAFLYNGVIEPFPFQGNYWRNEHIINYSTRLRDGNIAIGTQNAGLFIIDKDGNLIQHLDKDSGLSDRTVNYIYEDNQSNLWLAMNNGVSRVDLHSPFTMIDDRMGLSGSGYTALLSGDNIYLGTNNGLYRWNNGQMYFISGTEGQVYAVQEINGQILMGHHNGAFLIKNDRATQISDEKGGWIFRQPPGQNNQLIEGTYQGLNLLEWNNGKLENKLKIAGFDESSRVMEFDGNTLWIAQGYKGVFKVKLSDDLSKVTSSRLYKSEDGFPSDVLINVYNIANELVFTAQQGFFEYNRTTDRFDSLTHYNELIGTQASVVDLEADEIGNVYFIEQSKLGVIQPLGNHSFEAHTSPFNKVKDIWNDDLGNITVLDNNNILIGGRQGFIHYNPSADIDRTASFNILFRRISNLGRKDSVIYAGHGRNSFISNDDEVDEYRFLQNSFSFDYAAPHFESRNEVMYQYKLENYDKEWSAWTYTNSKEYTNLYEGDYTFRVKAKNIFDQETEEIQYQFHISPPVYRSTFAYILYTLGTLVLVFMAFKWLDKRHRKQTEELEQQQDQELKKKDSQIQSITEKSEAEIIRLRNDKLRTEVNLKSQALTSSAMHLIQKNQLLNNVKNTLKAIPKEEQVDKNLQTKLNRLVKSIDKDLAGGEEWSQFADNFDQVHGNFITRLKERYPALTPQEIKFSAYIRMNLNTKEIANLLSISVRGVEIGRYRVRKKLSLERKDNLSDFLMRF
jgi:DNA-binding CsgD family transcriptional regulator